MARVINTYQKSTVDGVVEVDELDNGMTVECLTEPNEAYLQKRADEQASMPIPGPTPAELLQEDNASLWYENMVQSTRVKSNETEVAGLWYSLMMGGI